MDLPHTQNPALAAIGISLERSLERHVHDNDGIDAALANLQFELVLAAEASETDFDYFLERTS